MVTGFRSIGWCRCGRCRRPQCASTGPARRYTATAVHHPRHTTATLLKNLGVPSRDAQIILGHSRLAVTLEICTYEDRQAQREALGKISDVLSRDGHRGSE